MKLSWPCSKINDLKKRKFLFKILPILCCALIFSCTPSIGQIQADSQDVTAKLIFLGNPFDKGPYARNVWDMQVFDGKIYLGHGNSTSQGPSPNAGPVPVVYYDPASNKFAKPYTVDEEQINIYKILNGKLYIPGHDATESWAYGNYYVLDNNTWHKIRSIPNASHVYDIASFQGNIYTANGTEALHIGEVMISKDSGASWISQMPKIHDESITYDGMVHTLFEFKGKLYAAGEIVWFDHSHCNILVMDGIHSQLLPVTKEGMMPGAADDFYYEIQKPCVVNNHMVYLGVKKCNVLHWFPDGLYVSEQINQARRVILPEQEALPIDIIIRDGTTYILAYLRISDEQCTNIVYKSDDLTNWTELFRFNRDTFARSFEELNGDFYFGLGCDINILPVSSGDIIKIPRSAYSNS